MTASPAQRIPTEIQAYIIAAAQAGSSYRMIANAISERYKRSVSIGSICAFVRDTDVHGQPLFPAYTNARIKRKLDMDLELSLNAAAKVIDKVETEEDLFRLVGAYKTAGDQVNQLLRTATTANQNQTLAQAVKEALTLPLEQQRQLASSVWPEEPGTPTARSVPDDVGS